MNSKELAYKKYGDIINMPRHVSMKHAHMSLYDRAAQFAPFAALTGYDAAIDETARLTDRQFELDNDELQSLELKLRNLQYIIHTKPTVSVTYFEADALKTGGRYISVRGILDKVDTYAGAIMLSNVDSAYMPKDYAADALESIRTKDSGKMAISLQNILDISQIED